MPRAVIASAKSEELLELEIAPDHGPFDARWTVKLQTSSVVATHGFWGAEPEELVAFFDDLAASWRGWDGRRAWTEVERDLSLAATHDGRGHVVLWVTLGKFMAPEAATWMVRAPLELEAGALDGVAAEVRRLLDNMD
jgi:hypothetical protein